MRRRELLTGAAALAAFRVMPADAALNYGTKRVLLGGGKGAAPPAQTTQFFEANGASYPVAYGDISSSAVYNASTNSTWFALESYQPFNDTVSVRAPMVAVYNHTTKTWAGPYLVGTQNALGATDFHGLPVIARDQFGYWWCAYGAHSSTVKLSMTVFPDDPTMWRELPVFGTNCTFPKLINIGATLYMPHTTTGLGGGAEGSLSFVTCTPSSGGTNPVWSSPKSIVDFAFDVNNWVIPSNFEVDSTGTNIHMLLGSFEQDTSFARQLFYLVFDTTTGNLNNYSQSTVVAPASQPVSLTTAQANFMVVDGVAGNFFAQATINGIALDSSGNAHVVWVQNASFTAPPQAVNHISNAPYPSSNAWSAVTQIDSFALTNPNIGCTPVPNGSGGIDAYFGDASVAGLLNPGSITYETNSGNILKSSFVAGAWTAPVNVLSHGTQGLFGLCPVIDSVKGEGAAVNANARLFVSEINNPAQTIIGNLKGFVLGDGGVLTRAVAPYSQPTLDLIAQMSPVPSAAWLSAIDTLISTLVANGTWFNLDFLHVLAAQNAQNSLLNWVDPAHYTLAPTGSPVFTKGSKYTFNGSNYLSTNWNPASTSPAAKRLTTTAYEVSLFAWFPSLIGTLNTVGCYLSPNGFYLQSNATSVITRLWFNTATMTTIGNGIGFCAVSRNGTSYNVQGGTSQTTGTGMGEGTLPSANLFVGAVNAAGGLGACEVSAVGGGENLTAGQLTALQSALSTYLTTVASLP